MILPEGYFDKLEQICRDHGVMIVDDEIQMGMFRTGKLWAVEHVGIVPDIIVFGKALTNGMNPLSGIWAKEELISPENFGPGSTHSTFASNTLGTAAGLEMMKILGEGQWEKTINEKGAYFLNLLSDLKSRHPEIGDGIGLALRLELCEADGFTPNRELADKMFQRGLEGDLLVNHRKLGIILDIGGYYKNVVTIAPSFHITYDEMDLAREILELLISECKKG